MHAELDHDLSGQHATAAQQEAIKAQLVELEREEFPRPKYDPPPPPDNRSLEELQAQAAALGIDTHGKNGGYLRRAIALAEKGGDDVQDAED